MSNVATVQALVALRPGAQWSMGDDLASLEWLDTAQTRPTDVEITAKASEIAGAPIPQSVLSQDLMAQFTADDATKIQAAVSGNVQFWLLWSAMQAQKDPMEVGNARFQAGWNALVQVLGQSRMDAIATALGVTIQKA